MKTIHKILIVIAFIIGCILIANTVMAGGTNGPSPFPGRVFIGTIFDDIYPFFISITDDVYPFFATITDDVYPF